MVPERDDDGGGLGAGRDERDDEEEDEEGDEGAAGAVALPRHGVTVLVQVGFHDDQLQLVAALTAGRRRDDLSALDAGAVRVVTHLEERKRKNGEEDDKRLTLIFFISVWFNQRILNFFYEHQSDC